MACSSETIEPGCSCRNRITRSAVFFARSRRKAGAACSSHLADRFGSGVGIVVVGATAGIVDVDAKGSTALIWPRKRVTSSSAEQSLALNTERSSAARIWVRSSTVELHLTEILQVGQGFLGADWMQYRSLSASSDISRIFSSAASLEFNGSNRNTPGIQSPFSKPESERGHASLPRGRHPRWQRRGRGR
jgi:hypothetical protein